MPMTGRMIPTGSPDRSSRLNHYPLSRCCGRMTIRSPPPWPWIGGVPSGPCPTGIAISEGLLLRFPVEARRRTGRLTFLPFLVSALALAVEAVAQDPATAALAACDGKTVTEIVITPHDPSFLSFPQGLRPLARGVGLHHTTSKKEMISRFILLEAGEECTERQRAESERILRLQPFLADASVRALPDSEEGVRIEVETIDEIPTVFGMRVRGFLPSALRFGNGNVDGRGLYLAGNLRRASGYRMGMGVDAAAHQVFGGPYRLSFEAERAPLGSTLAVALDHPFFTDLQRTAWHVGFRDVNRYLDLVPQEGDRLSLGVERRFWDAGGVRRLGVGRHGAYAGVLLTAESVTPASVAVVVSDSGLVADTTNPLGLPAPAYRNLRMNAVIGVRALSFMTARGFDALTAAQDVATGVQLGTVVGRGTSRFGNQDEDLFVAADLYAGRGSVSSFAAVRVEGEARRGSGADRWDSLVGSGRLAWYLKPADAHVVIGSVEFSGAWRQRVPFQLLLGDREGGVRGYSASRSAGATRAVLRLEERWAIGRLTRHGAFGLASFADGGWVWAGDAPFGTDSGMKAGVGIGLLAAFPPQSQRLWRVDLAVPVRSDPHAGWEVRLTSTGTRRFWKEPDDLSRGRAGASPATIFGWP